MAQSEETQSELDLHESRERLRMVAAAARLGWYYYDVERECSDWSRELVELLGFDPSNPKWTAPIPFDQILDRVHPDDREEFLRLRQRALQVPEAEPPNDHCYEGEFRVVCDDGELRWLVDRGRVLYSGETPSRPRTAIGIVMDITDRKSAESKLHELNKTLEKRVAQRTELLSILQYVTRIANEDRDIDEAMLRAMEKIASFNGWVVGHVWRWTDDDHHEMESSGVWYVQHDVDGSIKAFQELTAQTKLAVGEGLIGRVIESGKPEWITDLHGADYWKRKMPELPLHAVVAFPITVQKEVVAVVECFAEKRTRPLPQFVEVLPDIGIQLGYAVARKRIERLTAKIANEEQKRIGRELHDGISQQLTAGALIAETMRQGLPPTLTEHREHASQLVKLLKSTHQDVRDLSRGLMTEKVSAADLIDSLNALISEVECRFEMVCEFNSKDFDESMLTSNHVAWVIYQVAREAIHNAVKHAEADRVTVILRGDTQVHLIVQDDGKGFVPLQKSSKSNGTRIMKYRAESVEGTLRIHSSPGNGTIVAMTVPSRHD